MSGHVQNCSIFRRAQNNTNYRATIKKSTWTMVGGRGGANCPGGNLKILEEHLLHAKIHLGY